MAYKDPEVGRERNRECFQRRTAERRARGLCPRCGAEPPAPGRSLCKPCAEKKRVAGRARDAKLRAAGKPLRDLGKARAYERERSRRETAERLAQGLCPKCGKEKLAPDRRLCEPCGEKRRAAERVRYARGKAAGELYGGKDPKMCRRIAREKSKQRFHARLDARLCTRCGHRPLVEGGTTCEPCSDVRRAAEREQYAARRTAGRCTRCGEPTFGGASRCGPCAMLEAGRHPNKNAASRRRYARRRARGLCTDCAAPSEGASRCEPCARRSYVRSGEHRGLPIYPPLFTIIEIATGEDHGTFDSWEEVVMCLAFARLSYEEVEIISDQSPMTTLTGR